jgi:hypothetical protein
MADESLGLGVLRSDLQAARAKLQNDIDRKIAVRDQIDALINSLGDEPAGASVAAVSEVAAGVGAAASARASGRTPSPRRRARRPRGLITNKVREYLQRQSEPVHATRILQYLESEGAAPQSDKPMPTLQSTLQRMKESGEVRNTGRNRWVLSSRADAGSSSAATAAEADAGEGDSGTPAAEPTSGTPAGDDNDASSEGDVRRISSTTSFSSFSARTSGSG